MKLTLGKRIVIFTHSMCTILLCIALALRLILPGLGKGLLSRLGASVGVLWLRVAGIALVVIYAALAIAQLLFVLNGKKRRAERGFINVGSGDEGRVRIAVSAVEQMVRQSVRGIDGIDEMKINIDGLDDALNINVNAIVASGSHVPTLTRNMQRSIRQFVEVNCGVSVKDVFISIDAVSARTDGQRKRHWGRARGAATEAAQPVVPEPVAEEPHTVPSEEQADFATPSLEVPVMETPADRENEKCAVYDFDKPYESQFLKDLEELRAKEASDTTENGEAGGASEVDR